MIAKSWTVENFQKIGCWIKIPKIKLELHKISLWYSGMEYSTQLLSFSAMRQVWRHKSSTPRSSWSLVVCKDEGSRYSKTTFIMAWIKRSGDVWKPIKHSTISRTTEFIFVYEEAFQGFGRIVVWINWLPAEFERLCTAIPWGSGSIFVPLFSKKVLCGFDEKN